MNSVIPASLASEAPEWFGRAIDNLPKSHFVDLNGASVHYLSWNLEEVSKPGLVLVHGYRAHARWWDFIAPYLIDRYRVVALDLSGMGDSDHRASYNAMTFVDDILGVTRAVGFESAVVIGHSFGGARVLRACIEAPELIRHAIIIDSYIRFGDEDGPNVPPPRPNAPPYPDAASARQRFRLMPPQFEAQPWLVDYVARHSLRQVEQGWVWKFDRSLPTRPLEPGEYKRFTEIEAQVDLVYGEFSSVVDEALAQRMLALFKNSRGPIVIPDGYHHVMLAQPLALVATLRALLA